MFDNIGGKIKTLAKVMCWIGIIASVITAIVLWAELRSYLAWIGFVVLAGGVLVSWIGSFFVYGFGELIETNQELVQQGRTKGKFTKKKNKENCEQEKDEKVEENIHFVKIICPHCGKTLEFEKEMLESEDGIICPYCCQSFKKN